MPSKKATKKVSTAAATAVGFTDLPLASLVKAPWNYKTDDAAKQAKLVRNMRRNKQVENLIVRELARGKFEVVNGNHRFDALVEIGQAEVHVYNLGKVNDAAAKRIAIETNETKFESDSIKLAQTLQSLVEPFGLDSLQETMPWTDTEMGGMLESLNFDWTGSGGQQSKAAKEHSGFIVRVPASWSAVKKQAVQTALAKTITAFGKDVVLEDFKR